MMSVVSLVYSRSHRGSGFIVYTSPEAFLAMTCEHVVRRCKELQIFFPGETKPYKARVLKHDQAIDLALIRFVPDGECLERGIALKFVELNTPLNSGVVRMIGYHQVPEGRLLSPGVFDGKIIGEPIDDRIKCNYTSEEGTSGGPVLKGDRVIGVNSSYCGARRFAISVIGVRNTLRKWLNKGDSDIAGIDDMLAMLARE